MRKHWKKFLAALVVASALLVALFASAMAQDMVQVQSLQALCTTPSGYYVAPAGHNLPQTAPCNGSWYFEANGRKVVQGVDWPTFRAAANGVNGTVFFVKAEGSAAPQGNATPEPQADTADAGPQPMPTVGNPQGGGQGPDNNGPRDVPEGWDLDPQLPQANESNPYPGLRDAYIMSQQSDGLTRDVEVTVAKGQMFVMHGDRARVPGLGEVGGPTGCYLVVGLGPIVWDTQPTQGELPTIHWYDRSSWELHGVGPGADPMAWAATIRGNLMRSYPATCGEGVETWVFGRALVSDIWGASTDVIGYQGGFAEVATFAALCRQTEDGVSAYLVLAGNENLDRDPPCNGEWWFETQGRKDTAGASWQVFVTEARGKSGTVWLTGAEASTARTGAGDNNADITAEDVTAADVPEVESDTTATFVVTEDDRRTLGDCMSYGPLDDRTYSCLLEWAQGE